MCYDQEDLILVFSRSTNPFQPNNNFPFQGEIIEYWDFFVVPIEIICWAKVLVWFFYRKCHLGVQCGQWISWFSWGLSVLNSKFKYWYWGTCINASKDYWWKLLIFLKPLKFRVALIHENTFKCMTFIDFAIGIKQLWMEAFNYNKENSLEPD